MCRKVIVIKRPKHVIPAKVGMACFGHWGDMTRTRVCMDNCAFETIIEAELQDGEKAMLRITSDCASVQELAVELKEVSIIQIWQTIEGSAVYRVASRYLKHPACLIPAAIIRTIEVEAGMALPGKASVSVERK